MRKMTFLATALSIALLFGAIARVSAQSDNGSSSHAYVTELVVISPTRTAATSIRRT